MTKTQAALGTAILNRQRWDALCEDRRMLTFLLRRAGADDFEGVRVELERIAQGQVWVPDIRSPRKKAETCLRSWAQDLDGLE
jgi:hypothetical protein